MEMLVRQGEVAFERWTGIGSTADVMRSALDAWLAETDPEP
jgi:shikimate 5-dehydrogenase